MEQDLFIRKYLMYISSALSKHGYEPERLSESIMLGTHAMIKNDGALTNEQVFWNAFCKIYGEGAREDIKHFDRFYVEHFDKLASFTSPTLDAQKAVKLAHSLGIAVILATNPVFPKIAVHKRMAWAGLFPEEFEHITAYENSHYCKPNPNYYAEILRRTGYNAEECLMVGNDAREDTAAELLGIDVFLLTDCLINTDGRDISKYRNGNFRELEKYIRERKNES